MPPLKINFVCSQARYAICCLGLLVALATASNAQSGPVVRTSSGRVRGIDGATTQSFMGVPFAAPPLGDLRWQAPLPVKSWNGVRSASRSAMPCAAPVSGDGPRSENEDCLYLNIYRPRSANPASHLPVMVFFHGGANLWGTPNIYDGLRMAEIGHAIVVMPAYRLGAMGLLAMPAMADSAGDIMLQDQVAALRWVKANIRNFGGDSADVTLSGESAGSIDVCSILAAPQTAGLIHQAILQSGPCRNGPSRKDAFTKGKTLAAKLGCDTSDGLKCLQEKPVRELLDAWSAIGGQDNSVAWGGALLPHGPADAIASGDFAKVPLLIGFTRNEWWSLEHHLYPLSEDGLKQQLTSSFGESASAVAEAYKRDDYSHPEYLLGAAVGDSIMICPSLTLAGDAAHWVPVSTYEFADPNAPPFKALGAGSKRPDGYHPGATHTAELQYLYAYQAAEGPLNQQQKHLADQMIKLWISFGRKKNSAWPAFSKSNPVTVAFGSEAGDVVSSHDVSAFHHCDLWNTKTK